MNVEFPGLGKVSAPLLFTGQNKPSSRLLLPQQPPIPPNVRGVALRQAALAAQQARIDPPPLERGMDESCIATENNLIGSPVHRDDARVLGLPADDGETGERFAVEAVGSRF